MQTTEKIRVGDFYQLENGVIYQHEAVQDIKNELIALHGVKIVSQHPNEITFVLRCANAKSKVRCPYSLRFKKQVNYCNTSRKMLTLQSFMLNHHQSCRDEQQAIFLKNKHNLDKISSTLARLVQIRNHTEDPIRTPCHAIQEFAKQEQLISNFYLEGITSQEYKRKLKKKFDNIFALARNKSQKNKIQQKNHIQSQQTASSSKIIEEQYDPSEDLRDKYRKLGRKIRKFS